MIIGTFYALRPCQSQRPPYIVMLSIHGLVRSQEMELAVMRTLADK